MKCFTTSNWFQSQKNILSSEWVPPNSYGETLKPIVMRLGGGVLGCLGPRVEPLGGVSVLIKDPRRHWFPSRERAKGAGTPDGTAPLQRLRSRTPGALCGWCKTGDRPCTRPSCMPRSACHHQPCHAPHSCSCALRSAPKAEQLPLSERSSAPVCPSLCCSHLACALAAPGPAVPRQIPLLPTSKSTHIPGLQGGPLCDPVKNDSPVPQTCLRSPGSGLPSASLALLSQAIPVMHS